MYCAWLAGNATRDACTTTKHSNLTRGREKSCRMTSDLIRIIAVLYTVDATRSCRETGQSGPDLHTMFARPPTVTERRGLMAGLPRLLPGPAARAEPAGGRCAWRLLRNRLLRILAYALAVLLLIHALLFVICADRVTQKRLDTRPAARHAASRFDARLRLISRIAAERADEAGPHATVVTTLAVGWDALDSDVLPWLQWHTDIGVRHFFICWDGAEDGIALLLRTLPHVTLVQLRGAI